MQPISYLAKVTQENPLAVAISLTTIKTGAADIFAQVISAKDSDTVEIDWKRFFSFALYGAIYLGAFQYFLFTKVYTRMFPLAQRFAAKTMQEKLKDIPGLKAVFKQLATDALVHWPWGLIPAYYLIQECVSPVFSYRNMISKLRSNWVADLKMCWAIWLPAALFNYGSMPLEW
eukprot:CAMPEP_0202459692 /NCGR_PEP_ID=MMETSP1360-20130828/37765_1 /ASSEMBLY_ACC=CAM_ASM_000848 /TAXON_ID=515479 /ORGANISM="Licmophora paradoxa, Strain CCMP2313" /LENGTH=173 /DNA_ID=CAMNT_0049080909 /DNA_START=108 /DNA_END=626 /DNA_ORIENTATION=-